MDNKPSLRTIILSIGLILLLTLLFRMGNAQTAPNRTRTPVLVELFTSEGCSSCPPADALLAKLSHDQPVASAQIIILGEHVDYWDHLGWRDRFSSAQYTERQREYGSRLEVDDIYTPQMVVNGSEQFVGNDAAHALRAITQASQASRTPRLSLALSRPTMNGRRLSASVSATTPLPQLQGDIYAALVDPSDSTNVLHGENGGHRLQHAGVVRTLERVGSLKDLASGPHSFGLDLPKDAAPDSMQLVVFAQRPGPGAVLAAASTAVMP